MRKLNLQIFSENEDFYNDLDWFMCKNSKEYEIIKKRILAINQIFDTQLSRDLKVEYFLGNDLDGKFTFDNLLGQDYDAISTDVISLSSITHQINSININHINSEYSADVTILKTPLGNHLMKISEDILVLRPVYHTNTQQILTFNIDILYKTEKQAA